VQELVDKEAIRQVLHRFCRGDDRLDRELVQSCYHPDAIDDHGVYKGPALGYFDGTAAAREHIRLVHHHLGQSLIELQENTAVAETYAIVTVVIEMDGDAQTRMLMVRYLDRFENRDGEWKIADRFVAYDVEVAVPGGPPSNFPERNWGRSDRDDYSHALFAADAD
jgi:hypothetical protein